MAEEILDNQEQAPKAKKAAKTPKKKKEEALPTKTLAEIAVVEAPVEVEEPQAVDEKVEEVIETPQKTVEELTAELPVVDMGPAPEEELTRQAKGWRDWLAYSRMTPDEFLAKYPNHKMRHFIEEIIAKTSKK